MSEKARLRRLYDAVDRELAPRIKRLMQDEGFLAQSGTAMQLRRKLRERLDKTAARFWHRFNLPAGTDVQRLRQQVGEMDRELRRLRLQLEREQKQQKAPAKHPTAKSKAKSS